MYYADLGECYPPQPPLFDPYNSSDHTQPDPIIANIGFLYFNWYWMETDDLGIEPDRDNKKRLIPNQFFCPLFNNLFIYSIYYSSLNLLSLVGVNLIIIHVFSSLITVERCSCFRCSFLMNIKRQVIKGEM